MSTDEIVNNEGTISIYSERTRNENDEVIGIAFNATDFNDASCTETAIAEATALQPLRTLDTRTMPNVVPNTVGRTAVRNVLENNSSYSYNDLSMRRKAEVLKHKHNKSNHTSKKAFSNIVKGSSKYRHLSKAKLEKLVDDDLCSKDLLVFQNPGSFAGIRGDRTSLYLAPLVPYYDKI